MELNELSKTVYEHFIRKAVPDVTDNEVQEIMTNASYSNPLNYEDFVTNVYLADNEPEEGVPEFYTNLVNMVLLSDDPINKSLELASEYLLNLDIYEDNDDYVECETRSLRSTVRVLRENGQLGDYDSDTDDSDDDDYLINEDSDDDLDDDYLTANEDMSYQKDDEESPDEL